MSVVTQPAVIEQSSFTTGWVPDGENSEKDASALIDCSNLILDRTPQVVVTPTGAVHELASGGLITRGGFVRDWLLTGAGSLNAHWVRDIYAFAAPTGPKLVCVVTNGGGSANNVGLILVDLAANSYARMDTAGRTWLNPLEHHWGVAMEGVWYGGVRGEAMYSFTVAGSVWNADAGTDATWKTLVDAVNDSVTTTTQFGRDFAFKGKETVTYGGKQYSPARSIRFDRWDNDEKEYQVGDKVSRFATWASTSAYTKSFKCISKHVPATANAPGTGTDWKTFWTKVRLPLPSNTDEGLETSTSWNFVPHSPKTSIACWHADRMFMRYDDTGDRSRLLFSAPVKPDKGMDVPDVVWNPTDFAPGNDNDGMHGGWLPFNDGTHHGFITALRSYGDRLIVFKRQAVWALVGVDDSTWQEKRIIEGIGCVGPQSHAIVDGMIYFLSDEGLFMTDGNEVREAPGNQRVRDYIRTRIDTSQAVVSSQVARVDQYPIMWEHDGFIWIGMPSDESSETDVTLAYHPDTGSFYKTNLPVLTATRYRNQGRTHLAFGGTKTYSAVSTADPQVFRFEQTSTTQHNGTQAGGTPTEIAWNARMSWWSFSTLRAQRRIRRVWGLMKGVVGTNISIIARKDYLDSVVKTTVRAVGVATPTHYEGEWIPDSHAVNYEVSGTKAPASLLGFAVETQPRRARYHN